jgi:outer membrane protein W
MTLSTFPKLAALSLVLSAPAALASPLLQDDASDEAYEADSDDSSSSEMGPGFSLGLRAGYGLPFGNAVGGEDGADGEKLSDTVSSVIPLQLDVCYFLSSNLYLGGSFQYGIASLANGDEACEGDGLSCSVTQMRFGVNLAYHFAPESTINPWMGVGVGYETLTLSLSGETNDISVEAHSTAKGFEFANAQGGIDFRVSDTLSVGPFVTVTVAQYASTSTRVEAGDESEEDSSDIENKAIHGWVYGGLRLQARF